MNNQEPSDEEVQEACDKLRAILDKPDTPLEMRIKAQLDQYGARLRDMTEDEREQVIQNLVNNSELSEEDARDWITRLVNEST